jgi:hypothetical protein
MIAIAEKVSAYLLTVKLSLVHAVMTDPAPNGG